MGARQEPSQRQEKPIPPTEDKTFCVLHGYSGGKIPRGERGENVRMGGHVYRLLEQTQNKEVSTTNSNEYKRRPDETLVLLARDQKVRSEEPLAG